MTTTWSVVICCHNSGDKILSALSAIDAQTVAMDVGVEIVVVDNNCSDDTVTRAQRFAFKNRCILKVVKEATLGQAFARMTGVAVATGRYACFVDDDNQLFADYLERAQEILEAHDDVVMCGGQSVYPTDYRVPLIGRFFSKAIAVGRQREYEAGYIEAGSFLWGAGLCVRRPALARLYELGFVPVLAGRVGRQLLSGDDGEIAILLQAGGSRGYYSSTLRLWHRVNLDRLSLPYFAKLLHGMGIAWPVLGEYARAVRASTARAGNRGGIGIPRRPGAERIERMRAYGPGDVIRICSYVAVLSTAFLAGTIRGRWSGLVPRARRQGARITRAVAER